MKFSAFMRYVAALSLLLCSVSLLATERNRAGEDGREVVRILAIGNSFSEDAIDQYFHELCQAAGKRVVVGNLYIPGCPLDRHLLNARTDSAAYRFRRIGLDGATITASPVRLSNALGSDNWDFISMQQSSPLSGIYGSYAPVKPLIEYVDSLTDGGASLMWQQTWAYSPDSSHGAFPTYKSDQKLMYDSIVSAARQVMDDNKRLTILIPTGDAIQNARVASGDYDLTRDGYHLSIPLGRYIAACTWFEAIFGESVVGNPYYPDGLTPDQARLAQESAHAANQLYRPGRARE